MPLKVKVLLVEDVESDAELALRELKRAGFRCEGRRVENEVDFRREMTEFHPDVVLSDFSMPHFDGMQALAIAAQDYADIPFIFVSGNLGEEYAVRALKNGATDYVLKTNLIRLPAAVERAMDAAQKRRERQSVERDLRESEERFRQMAENIREVFWMYETTSGVSLYVSPAYEQIWQRSIAEVGPVHQSWLESIHPDDRQRVTESLKSLETGNGSFDLEYRITRQDGSLHWIHDRGFPIRDAQDRIYRVAGIAEDVTARKQAEQRINRLNRVYAVLSAVNSAIVRIRDRQELYQETCRIIVERGGFSVGWMGVLNHASGKLVEVAQAGLPEDLTTEERAFSGPKGVIPLGASEAALREKRPAFDNDIARDPGSANSGLGPTAKNVRRMAIQMGAKSVVSLPLFVDGETFGILSLYAPERNFFDEDEIKLLSGLAGDISFALEYLRKEEKLNYLAYYDALTGLPNSTLFRDRLTQFVQGAKPGKGRVAVILVNLDRFRHLNDTLGRHAGDALLKIVGDRLNGVLPEPFTLARISADSFAIAVADIGHEDEIANLLQENILATLGRPCVFHGEEIRISAKAGVALFPGDGTDAEALFRNSEAALKKAKSSSERFVFYAPELNAHVAEKLTLENKLRLALEREEFVLYYQPKVNVADGKICGLEALIRWNDPETGLVPPLKFIPLLEEIGLIMPVGEWALRKAMADFGDLCARGVACPRMAVNVSPTQLKQKDFAGSVAAVIGHNRHANHGLDLEITESVIMENIGSNIRQLQAVRDLGVNIAIDDFGTGYSSLAYIARLPVNTLKIDRSFVLAMAHSAEDRNIVSTIISLAHSLGLKVVAEGVETAEQLDFLRALQCDQIQGYLISMPLPIEKLEGLLHKAG